MFVFVRGVAEQRREDGEATTFSDALAPEVVRLSVPIAKTLTGGPCPGSDTHPERVRGTYVPDAALPWAAPRLLN